MAMKQWGDEVKPWEQSLTWSRINKDEEAADENPHRRLTHENAELQNSDGEVASDRKWATQDRSVLGTWRVWLNKLFREKTKGWRGCQNPWYITCLMRNIWVAGRDRRCVPVACFHAQFTRLIAFISWVCSHKGGCDFTEWFGMKQKQMKSSLPLKGKIRRFSHPVRFCICAWRYSKRPDYAWLWHAEFISMISSSSEYSQELHPPHGMHKDWVSVCQWTTGSEEDSSSFILLRSLACLMVLSTRGDTMPRIVVIFMTWTSV